MIRTLHKKIEEYHSPILALLYIALEGIIRVTTLSVFRFFGLNRENFRVKHLEINLVATTLILIGLIVAGLHVEAIGWITLAFGLARILQIIALNAMTLLFGQGLLPSEIAAKVRVRWHLIAILFSAIDISLIYAFAFNFLNQEYQILNINPESFLDHFYYSMITLMTVGYGDIVPITPLGKILAISEALTGVFLFVFLVNAALTRFQRHHED